jgi:hypothetical protein
MSKNASKKSYLAFSKKSHFQVRVRMNDFTTVYVVTNIDGLLGLYKSCTCIIWCAVPPRGGLKISLIIFS